jgi:hypothetical protein
LFSPLYGRQQPKGGPGISPSAAVVRERQAVTVDSGVEEWRLEWRRQPEPACDPSSEDWYTCPCAGFAFGETGELDLVRKRAGKAEERLALSPYFEPYNDGKMMAILPKWPVMKDDFDRTGSAGFAKIVQSRPVVRIMKMADYDHDGRATEFLLQIGAGPCGHRQTVAVGISRTNPKLHVFGTVAYPLGALVLESPESWEKFLHSSGKTTITEWPCGDHGGEEESIVELTAVTGGIRTFRMRYACTPNGRGRLLERKEQ